MWWHPLATNLKLALTNDAHTQILLVIPLSAALIYFDAKENHLTLESRVGLGVSLLLVALFLRVFTAWNPWQLPPDDRLSVGIFALVIWWIGGVVFILGCQVFRSFLFPLCFLFLLVPLPEHALSLVTEFLQQQSALAASLLFRLARVPVTRHDIVLSVPGLDIVVASECSSIRSSMMLLVTTMFLSHLFLRSWWKKTFLIVLAIPLSVAKNGLRIFTIAELATQVDPGYLDGRLHHHGGIVFFAVALTVVGVLLWVLKRGESRTNAIAT